MIVRDPARLLPLQRIMVWYVETRPHQVKNLVIEPEGGWAVGPTAEGRVRWLFEKEVDQMAFFAHHRHFVLIKGTFRPVQTDSRSFQ